MALYELQGAKASVAAPIEEGKGWLIWVEGRSPATADGIATVWEQLADYYPEFEHPLWRAHRAEAVKYGHSGGDYFALREFCAAIRENRKPRLRRGGRRDLVRRDAS